MKNITAFIALAGAAAGIMPTAVYAQDNLMAMEGGELRSEVQRRYDAGLSLTNDSSAVSANDPRYTWASEAKAQCGIALGFLKSNTKDETSISRCALAYDMMQRMPQPRVAAAPEPAPQPEVCNREAPGLIFFEFDSATPQQDAVETVQYVVENAPACNWRAFTVVGHTDRAGSNAYNEGLSLRRAEAVANLMASRGIPAASISTEALGEASPRVPTADGVRELQNRRVEIRISE